MNLHGNWITIFNNFYHQCNIIDGNYAEAINFNYEINPLNDFIMSCTSTLFKGQKARAIYNWYKDANPYDDYICKFFDEYKHCIDDDHMMFNSNYGRYVYDRDYGIEKVIERLEKNSMTRQATIVINSREAMSDHSIDKLCTNTIQFFIRNDRLLMLVNMRASNFITLLPYDVFMFCFWYLYVYNRLLKTYPNLKVNNINIHADTIHFYLKDIYKVEDSDFEPEVLYIMDNYKEPDFVEKFEEKLGKI